MIIGIFVFAAVATPTGDPWTMTASLCRCGLYFIAAGICAAQRPAARPPGVDGLDYAELDDDEACPLDDRPRARSTPSPSDLDTDPDRRDDS